MKKEKVDGENIWLILWRRLHIDFWLFLGLVIISPMDCLYFIVR